MFPKIKANEPDILLVGIYGQDPGSFANQAATAGLKAHGHRLRVHARRRERVEGHVRQGRLHVRLRLLRRRQPEEPAGQDLRRGVQGRSTASDPDFYAANFYENTFVMWEVIRRVLKARRRHQRRRRPRQGAAGQPDGRQRLRRRRHDGRHLHPRPDDPLGDQAGDGRLRVQGRQGDAEGVLRHRRRRLQATA